LHESKIILLLLL